MESKEYSRLLVLSGTPESGKTAFGRWLQKERGFLHIDIENDGLTPHGLHDAFWADFIHRSDLYPFVSALRDLRRSVVLDWGYPTWLWPRVAQLGQAGLELWWFEADRLAARDSFQNNSGKGDVFAFDCQTANIAAAWSQLGDLYQDHVIRALAADGSRLPFSVIAEQILDHAD